MSSLKKASVKMIGVRPLLFDRYQGSNDAQPEPVEKVYWDQEGYASIPLLNIFSGLSAENTKSVSKQFYGRNAKKVGMAINSYLTIFGQDIRLFLDGDPVHIDSFESKFNILEHVARLDKGIPNPKRRPCLGLPWTAGFDIEFIATPDCTWEVLTKCLHQLGGIGVGTYRPMFGTFRIEIEEK